MSADFLDSRAFDGETYIPIFDADRLGDQLKAVYNVLKDGNWYTIAEIESRCPGMQTGISARIRDFRKEKFGHFLVESQRRGDPKHGIWEWRLGPQQPIRDGLKSGKAKIIPFSPPPLGLSDEKEDELWIRVQHLRNRWKPMTENPDNLSSELYEILIWLLDVPLPDTSDPFEWLR